MFKLFYYLFVFIFFLTPNLKSADNFPHVDGELIVQLREGKNIQELTNKHNSLKINPTKLLSRRLNIWLVEFDNQRVASEDALNAIRQDNMSIATQFNHFVKLRSTIPNDPSFNLQWGLNNTGETGGTPDADIDAPEAWDLLTGGFTVQDDEIVIAVIDDGADLNHPDLNFWKNNNEIPGNGIDDDNNGYVDDYDGWNAKTGNGEIPVSDHGTHVCGIAGAIGNNNRGISGVNWNVKIMPVIGASTTESVVVEAYNYILDMRAIYNQSSGTEGAFVVVTNSSFGIDYGNPEDFPIWCSMYDAMGAEGILSCAATMDKNENVDVVGDMPTTCSSDYLISVTNTTKSDQKNSYPGAGYGEISIDLGAPGTSIFSTISNNHYDYITGTSMASPHVAGVVALMFAYADNELIQDYKNNPGTYALSFKQWLLSGVDPITALHGITISGGRLNAFGALQNVGAGVEFQFTNRIQGTTNYGELIVDNDENNPISSGGIVSFYPGPFHEVRTNELPFIPNWQGSGTTQKHHRFYESSSDYGLNHQFQALDITPTLQDAWFVSTEPAVIKNLISGGDGGTIEFRDPWHYYQNGGNWQQSNEFINFPSPLDLQNNIITSYGGVFLDQDPSISQIYYTVRAPQEPTFQINGKDIICYFEDWETDGAHLTDPTSLVGGYYQSPVVFEDSNAIVKANYKAHLGSNTSNATAGNNGSKLSYHYSFSHAAFLPYLVYEDRGNIYEAHQVSPGEWTKDGRIAAAGSHLENHFPAVTYLDETYSPGIYNNKRLIAWEQYNGIMYNYSVRTNLGTFPWPEYLNEHHPHPAAAGYYLYALQKSDPRVSAVVAFRGGSMLKDGLLDGIRLWFMRNPCLTEVNRESSADYPSIDNRKYISTLNWREPHYMLAWQETDGIHYNEFQRVNDQGSTVNFGTEVVLNAGYSYLSENMKPSLQTFGTYDDQKERVAVAWQARDGSCSPCHGDGTPVICFREKTYSGWQSLQMFTGVNSNPSVTGWYAGETPNAGIACERADGQILCLERTGGVWSPPMYIAGNAANPAVNTISGTPSVIWTETGSAPYRIMFTTPGSNKEEDSEPIAYSRRLSFGLMKSLIGSGSLNVDADVTLVMAEPEIISLSDSKKLLFQYHDSLMTPGNMFQSLPFAVSEKDVALRIPVRILCQNSKYDDTIKETDTVLPFWEIYLKDPVKDQMIADLNVYKTLLLMQKSSGGYMISDTIEIDLKGYVGAQIQVAAKTFLEKNADNIGIAEVYDLRGKNPVNPKLFSRKNNIQSTFSFRLYPNWPNPFNPTTTISFDLPGESAVSVVIYDITGKQIKSLASRRYSGGNHQIQWDGRDDAGNPVASGIYIYRLLAGEYVQSRKMMLMK
ncbi:MAG: S8 family serine peptidase [Calditrichia bacterium]